MTPEEFKNRMQEIYTGEIDTEVTHAEADNLMVEALKNMGYDLSDFEEADKWYA